MTPQLSIITAIHNGLPMNSLFWKSLSQNTSIPFELIIIDNHSTDGSELFFKNLTEANLNPKQRVIHLRNEFNQSYPASQNQGIQNAKSSILCFLNNDIFLPKNWEMDLHQILSHNPLQVISFSGIEAQSTQNLSNILKRRWKRILLLSKLWKLFFKKTEEARLWHALKLMYGDLENFKPPYFPKKNQNTMPGINGCAVVFHKEFLKAFPKTWDERFQAADWNLYLAVAKQKEIQKDLPLPVILLNRYIHHFGRYSLKNTYEPMVNETPLVALESEWTSDTIRKFWWGYSLPKN